MKRALKWATLALIAVEAALVRFNLLDIRAAIGIIVAVEALLILLALRHMVVATKTYRRGRREGLDAWMALENGLEVLLPRKAARVLAAELRLWYCLATWPFRRSRGDEDSFSYSGRSMLGPVVVLLLFTTPAEVFLIELIIPLAWLKWLLAVAAVYGFFWIVGLRASMSALPHRLGRESIRLSYGILASADIPYSDIAQAMLGRNDIPLRNDGVKIVRDRKAAYFAVGGNTDILLRLKSPRALQGWLGPMGEADTLYIAADQPGRLVESLHKRIESQSEPLHGAFPPAHGPPPGPALRQAPPTGSGQRQDTAG